MDIYIVFDNADDSIVGVFRHRQDAIDQCNKDKLKIDARIEEHKLKQNAIGEI